MNVNIYSREEIEKLLETENLKNTAIISFYDPAIRRIDKDYKPVNYSGKCDRVFLCELNDLDIDVMPQYDLTYNTFFPEADELAEFIYKAKNDGLNIICQCEYGQSRSAGCAGAILEHFYKNGISIFTDYRYFPNQVVYHKVFDALEKYKKEHSAT